MSDEQKPKCKHCGKAKDENPAHAEQYTGTDKHVFEKDGQTSGPGKEDNGGGE